jgi:hypothetical protein
VINKPFGPDLSKYLRAMAVICSLVLIGFIGTGTMMKARPGAFITRPVYDFWAITIAISNVNLGLQGGLGYPQIYQKLHSFFSNSESPYVFDNGKPYDDPQYNDQVIKAAAAMTNDEVKGGIAENGDYLLYLNDDIGYAYFYTLAFRLFGFGAFATHWLYLLILSSSFLVFVAAWRRSNSAIALAALTVGALFLATNSAAISPAVPNVSSNRFLSTLSLLPMLHLLMAALDRKPLTLLDVLFCAIQAVMLALAIWFRSSAMWAAIALLVVALVMICRARPAALTHVLLWTREMWRRRVLHLEIDSRSKAFRPAFIAGMVAVVLVGGASLQDALLDRIYFSDAVFPKHFFWHSLWVGLVEHPDWPLFKPFDEQPDFRSDNVPYEVWTRDGIFVHGLPVNTPVTTATVGGRISPMRLSQDVERRAFLSFAASHPIYMLELEAYYKPRDWIVNFVKLARSVPVARYLLCFPLVILGFLLFRSDDDAIDRGDLYVAFALVWLCSLLPSIVAYPIDWALGESYCVTLVFASVIVLGADRKAVMSMRLIGRQGAMFLGAAAVAILAIWGASRLLYDPAKIIRIVEAEEKADCHEAEVVVPGTILTLRPDYARDYAALTCNGKIGSCTVPVRLVAHGPLPSGCANEFEVKYRCGKEGQVREAAAAGEGNERRIVLSCAAEHG